jgi:hypothetical protein
MGVELCVVRVLVEMPRGRCGTLFVVELFSLLLPDEVKCQ